MQSSIVAFTSTSGQSCNWVFTLNNPVPEDEARLNQLFEDNLCDYLVYGRETGESGTPHLQGFVAFREKKRFNAAKRLLGARAHLERARRPSEAAEYCKKDGDYEEFGEMKGRGKRNELDLFKADVQEGMLSLREIREKHSNVYARYTKFVIDYVNDYMPEPPIDFFPLREWQQNLYVLLCQEPNSREILFIVDPVGNNGKSWFARYFKHMMDNVQIIVPGKKADMAYMLDSTCKYFFFDAPRSKQGDFIQYDFLEEIKNGYVFSSKYESRMKTLDMCHVIVLMNENPDMAKLSLDRYKIITL